MMMTTSGDATAVEASMVDGSLTWSVVDSMEMSGREGRGGRRGHARYQGCY